MDNNQNNNYEQPGFEQNDNSTNSFGQSFYASENYSNVVASEEPTQPVGVPTVPTHPVEPKKTKSKKKLIIALAGAGVAVVGIVVVLFVFVLGPSFKYSDANDLLKSGDYDEAIAIYKELGDYKDSENKIDLCKYQKAGQLTESGKYDEAIVIYTELGNYKNCKSQLSLCKYNKAVLLCNDGKYGEAAVILEELGDYEDSAEILKMCNYEKGSALIDEGKYDEAKEIFKNLGDYEDSKDMLNECDYQQAIALVSEGKYDEAVSVFEDLGDYEDSSSKAVECNRRLVHEYCSNRGAVTIVDGKFTFKLKTDGDNLNFNMYMKSDDSGGVEFDMFIDMTSDNCEFEVNVDSSSFADGKCKVSELTSDENKLKIDTNTGYGTDEQMTNMANLSSALVCMEITPLLKKTNLGLAANDLGFVKVD
ncbi:MAG: tetratricopeptide repeat protein [Clostridia bacterium]|nr:tetratricopeptide repeat protein [Clostridia bacterium]